MKTETFSTDHHPKIELFREGNKWTVAADTLNAFPRSTDGKKVAQFRTKRQAVSFINRFLT